LYKRTSLQMYFPHRGSFRGGGGGSRNPFGVNLTPENWEEIAIQSAIILWYWLSFFIYRIADGYINYTISLEFFTFASQTLCLHIYMKYTPLKNYRYIAILNNFLQLLVSKHCCGDYSELSKLMETPSKIPRSIPEPCHKFKYIQQHTDK